MWSVEDVMVSMMADRMLGASRSKSPEEYKAKILEEHRGLIVTCEEIYSHPFPINETVQAPITHKRISKLATAKPISFKEIQEWHELNGDKVFTGRVLLCTTLEWPIKMTSIMTVVEDGEGRAGRLALYNLAKPSSDPRVVLPKRSMLAIIDPFYERTVNGGKTLRVDNPQTVVFFSGEEEFADFKRRKGVLKVTTSDLHDNHTPALSMKSAEELKTEGNEHFQCGQYKEAILCYTKALQSRPNDPTKVILLSNRAECLLRTYDFQSALTDACAAMELDPSHLKSRHRRCKALVGLRRFVEAAKVLPDHAGNSELGQSTRKNLARGLLEECEGKFDVYSMMKEAETDPLLLGHADYVCPDTEIVRLSSQRGRGGLARNTIKFGTIIMASKAVAISFAPKSFPFNFDPISNRINSDTQSQVVGDLMRQVTGNPDLGKQLYDLYNGTQHIKHEPGFDHSNVDVGRIRRIVRYNAFNGTSLSEVTNMASHYSASEGDQKARRNKEGGDAAEFYVKPTGLWIKQSYLNHSCLPNCSWFCVGDYMFVVASKEVQKGEELVIAYVDPLRQYTERKEILERNFGFRCTCERCSVFHSQPRFAELEQQIEEEFAALHEAVDVAPPRTIVPRLEGVVKHATQAFGAALKHTSCHSMPLKTLVSVLERGGCFDRIAPYSRMVSAIPEQLLGKGNTYWVMAKIHEVVALTRMQDSKRVPLLVDTCRHFLALFHTSPHHFQRAYIDPTPPLKEVFPDISEVFSSSEHKHKDKHEAEEGADIGNE